MVLTTGFGTVAAAEDRYWQCAAFAREFSGLNIHGDAATWWNLADGIYARGYRPRVGAVMAFVPTGRTPLGHVATVTGIIDPRTITVTHANWSLIDGQRGQIERNVQVRDVSDTNDWSQVRVWFAPLNDLGTTAWPVRGFIYSDRTKATSMVRIARLDDRHPVPRLSYAGLDQVMRGDWGQRPALIDRDVMRLAMLEQQGRRPR